MTKTLVLCFAVSTLLLAGCASTQRPVLYPNAKLKQAGDAQAQRDTDECIALAENAGANASDASRAARPAVEGAAVGGAVGAVGNVIRGRGNVVQGAAGGAAIGGTAGAVHGAFRASDGSPVHRNFVQRCLHERGYDVIGWK